MSLVSIFATAILPIVTIAAVGFALARLREVDPEPLNTVTLYVLAPALIFHSLATSPLRAATLGGIAVGVGGYIVAMAAVSEVVGRLLGEREPILSALVLVATFPNAGNYGIPLSSFAFGAIGRSTAVLFLAVQSVLVFTVGVYVAARSGGASGLHGVRRVLTVPLIYAVGLALAARWLGVVPPAAGTAMQTVKLVGDSSIPVLLLILGIQLARTDYGAAIRRVGPPTALKMAVAPAIGVAVALAIGFDDPTVARVFVLECATPAAVTPLLLLVEFGDDAPAAGISAAEYVSATVLVTTLLSVPVLTLLIAVLQSGVLL